jgi:endonuclease IV
LDPKDLPRVLGRAWEASNEEGIKRVNTVLGLTLGEAQAKAFADLRSEIAELKTENRAMRVALVEMAQMKAQMAMLQAAIGKLTQNGQRRVISTASVE